MEVKTFQVWPHKKKHYLKAGAQCQEGQVDISLTFNQPPIEQPIYTTDVPLLRKSSACYGVWVCVPVSISPGLMKLLGEGGTPKLFVMSGELKSSISLLRIIPVDPDMTLEPKLRDKSDRWDIKGTTGKVGLTNIGICLGQEGGPYYRLMVLVADTALPSSATTEMCEVP